MKKLNCDVDWRKVAGSSGDFCVRTREKPILCASFGQLVLVGSNRKTGADVFFAEERFDSRKPSISALTEVL